MSAAATRWFSLRRRLLLWLLVGVTAGWLGAMGYAYVEAQHGVEYLVEQFEEHETDSHEARRHLHHELLEHFVGVMFMPLLLGLPLLGAWIWFATRQGLAPVAEIAAEVAGRDPERLDPISPAAAPKELRPLLDALNGLLGRVAVALERERGFTADAAHELRTPLAAIATQAEVASRAREASERDHALNQIVAGSRRAAHLVDQLLTLARLDPVAPLVLTPVGLDSLAAEVCADHGALALEKHIDLALEAPGAVIVQGSADGLRILLRNLVDNAVRYTPSGGKISVAVAIQDGAAVLSVSDSGPGIPPEQRENVLQRFHRLAGQDTDGSGLGLSIVARIAQLHRARLELADGIGQPGLAVRLSFPGLTNESKPG
jgi:signal transduction histidine kinase